MMGAPPGGMAAKPAPMGASPATGPTPNKGFEAAAQQKLAMVVSQLEQILPQVGAGSEPGQAVMKAIQGLAKFVPAGTMSPASQKNSLEQMQMKAVQQNAQMQALKAASAGGGGPPGGAPPGAAPGGPPPGMGA